jgi:uncharacterized protein (TIGR03067 family)
MRPGIISLCILGLAAGFCRAGEGDPVKADLDQFQGEWVAVRAILNGRAVEITDGKTTVTFSGKSLTMNGRKGAFTIDPSRKPKTMRCDLVSGEWCYRLDGDDLVIAFGTVGQETLPDIEGKDGKYVLILKRKAK